MIDEIPASARFEIKFVAEASRYGELEQWIRLHPEGFRNSYPPRRVNNVYFDTQDLDAFAENLSGASSRSKLRLRWYGVTDAPERTVLEVKRRRNQLGWKHHYDGGPMDFERSDWRTLRRRLRDRLSPVVKLWFDSHPFPVLINRYDRQYFESPEGKIRATLDWHQCVYDQRVRNRPNLRHQSNLPETVVCEIKLGQRDRKRADRISEGIPVRVSRNSKYVIGVRSILLPLGS